MRQFKNMVKSYYKKIERLKQIPQNVIDAERQAYFRGMRKGLEVASHMMNLINGIRYAHNCNQCVFLGFHNEYDLYYCPQDGDIPTVLARFGNESEEYQSGFGMALPALTEAERIAKDRGMIKEK